MDEALTISLAGVPDRDDAELARAATEDRAAFAAIYERHRTPVYRYLRSRTATDADAQDLTAITFERAKCERMNPAESAHNPFVSRRRQA